MDTTAKTSATKSAPFPQANPSQAFQEVTEKGTRQAKETYEKMSVASTQAAGVIKSSCATAVRGMQDYNNKIIEFAQTNTNANFEFVQKLFGVKSPSEFVALTSDHARQQFETLTKQTQQLAALAQTAALATTEPLKTNLGMAFNLAA